jgi:acyl-coenzyme A thioesterase PaaI-like protein
MYDKPAPDEEGVFNPFASEDISPPYSAHWEAKRRLAQALRELTDTMVTSNTSTDHLSQVAEAIEAQTRNLETGPRLYGVKAFMHSGEHGRHGEVNHELNAVGGWSNPLSPGLNMWVEGTEAWGTVTCHHGYEGPPGFVHGGFVAAIFDQFLGMAQIMGKSPGMTGTLTVRYHRPTPLNTELRLHADLQENVGRKTRVTGEMYAGDTLTASCEALFVRPRQPLPER